MLITTTINMENPLKCLLTVEVTDDYEFGTILNLTEIGGKNRRVTPPFKPYIYSRKYVQGSTPVQRIFLSDMKTHTCYKIETSSTRLLERFRSPFTFEDNIPFKMRVAIDLGYRFPSKFPKIIAWDCETKLAGISPNPLKDKLISIATWGADESDRRFFTGDRRKIITDFLHFIREADPDIPTEFYGRFYDYQVLVNNCHELGIKCALGRNGEEPQIQCKEFEKMGKGKLENTILIRGRVAFDVHKEVESDYTLTLAGLKTRGLKETARHYGMNPIEIDYEKMDQLTPEQLKAYNLSDAEATYKLAMIYLEPLYEIAEYLDIPLDMVIHRNPSHIANIVIGRGFVKEGIVADGCNKERFPEIFRDGCKAIQGAEPKCFRSGIYLNNVKHKDFSSMYVSINRALNLSPETVSLVSLSPYTGKYVFEPHKDSSGKYDYCIVEVPDKINGQVQVKIDLSRKGIMRKALDDITERRRAAKKQWKETGDNKYNSQQIALKLIGNIFFGYSVMPYAIYGNVLIGILDTAIARLLIDSAMSKEEKAGNILLEADTDGYFFVENQKTTFSASEVLPDCFETDLIYQESEDVQGMILLQDKKGEPAAKSYILKDDKGKITKHGSSVLGKHIPPIIDAFVDELANAIFNGEDVDSLLRSWNKNKILKFPLKAFVSTAKFTKRPNEYDSNSMYAALVAQLQKVGINVEWGNNISYVKTRRGYVPSILLSGTEEIDCSYYQSRMIDVASRILGRSFDELKTRFDGDKLLEQWF